jgi:hypothetical protein
VPAPTWRPGASHHPAPRRAIRDKLETWVQQQRSKNMIVTDHQPHRVNVAVFGEFTLADYREFEELVNFKVKFEGPVDLLFDLRQMGDFTLDVAWEELKFSRTHPNDFNRIAVVTDSQWLTWTAWLSQIFVNAEMRIFSDADEAAGWLDDAA